MPTGGTASNKLFLVGPEPRCYYHQKGTPTDIASISPGTRIRVEQTIDRFLPYTTQGALPTHPMLVKAYLKVPLAWRVLGKQFFIVARKPA